MKKSFMFLLALGIWYDCFSQPSASPIVFPKMAPPSPEASSLGRYGEFPVSLSTGTPEISIPLYEINTGKLKLPISVSYHASGIRVNDVASRVGLGWALQAGGLITRVVKGLPDDAGDGYYSNGIPPSTQQDSFFKCFVNRQYILGNADGDPDIFFYSTPAKSGKFVFTNRRPSGSTPQAVTIPYDLIKISFGNTKITITDVDGTTYVYGTSLLGRLAYEVTTSSNTSSGPTFPGAPNYISSWYLTDILSADKSDTIKLIYSNPYYVAGEHHVSTVLTDDIADPQYGSANYCTYTTSASYNDVAQIRLAEIDFRNGKVSFDYNTGGRADETADSSIVGLRVFQYVNKAYTQIKRYILYQSYFSCRNIAPQAVSLSYFPGDPSKRLRLDSLKEADINGNTIPGYSFGYSATQLPYICSYAQDLWGFYNAANNANLLIYNVPVAGGNANPPSITYGANRNVNADSVNAGMLKSIVFPTGGSTTFQFESNTLNSFIVGGLRIKKIISYDALGGATTKTYNYYNPVAISNLFNGSIPTTGLSFSVPYQSDEAYPPSSVTKSYACYLENFTYPLGSSSGSAVSYGQVEELYDSVGGVNGKIVYTYTTPQDISVTWSPQITIENEWARGLVLTEQKYSSPTIGNFVLLHSKQNIYTYNDRPSLTIYSLASKPLHLCQYNSAVLIPAIPNCAPMADCNTFLTTYCPRVVGNNYLTQTIDTLFDQNGSNPKINVTNFYYDDTLNIQPIRIEGTNSKGVLVKQINWTPLEKPAINTALALTATASTAIDSMVAKNMIGTVIDNERYYGGIFTGRSRTNYKVFNANLVAPANLQVQIASNAIETRLQYNNYDNYGNVISGGKVGAAPTTYIWDYQKAFVIAQVTNADSSSVAYTSFESDGLGNWILSDTTRYRTYSMTGNQSYNLVTGKTITKSVAAGKSYLVSYWSRSGAVTVTANGSGVAATLTGLTKNGWTYYEHALASTTTTISITATNAIIDELRLYPNKIAQMTSYTYNPLVGVSSVCSPGNLITYYEYDNFSRLKTIRDIDKNVVKVMDYEYQASPHTFYSTQQSGGFARNNCTSCLMGTTVTYTVLATAYTSVISQADADQQAINDVNNNGQAYANANGSCVTPTTAPITGSNGTTKSFTITFHNTCTNTNYNFTLPVTTGTPLSPVPVGTYNISIAPVGGTGTYTYNIDGFFQNGTSVTFNGISIGTASNTLVIH